MAPAFDCPADHQVIVDFAQWARSTRKASTVEALGGALGAIGLDPVLSGDEAVCTTGAVSVQVVDTFHPALSPGRDVVVAQVLARVCEGPDAWSEGPHLQRGAVYVPLERRGAYCRVDTPGLNRSGSGWGPQLCNPAVFSFERLVADDTDTLRIVEQSEWCGSAGSDRGGESSATWYRLDGATLVPIFSTLLTRAYYHSPTPPVETTEVTVTPRGEGFPRMLRVETRTTCDEENMALGADLDTPDQLVNTRASCTAVHAVVDWIYRDGRYVEAVPQR
jgi:hypothetical protein